MTPAEQTLLTLSGIFVLGIGGQWIASLTRVPSILVLLGIGILVGPTLGWIDPDELLGDMVLPLVSLCVAMILFEGSLSLRFRDLRQIGRPVFLLLSVGVLVTWGVCTTAAVIVLQFELPVALLLGAILTVTGPTVVGPLLNLIRPTGVVGPIARWEGIVVDPIGAVLAVLVFQTFQYVNEAAYTHAVWIGTSVFVKTVFFGSSLGVAAAKLILYLLKRHLVSDHLQSAFSLMMVAGVFAVSNLVAHESGLVTVTVMGLVLANQQSVSIRRIVEFKENLSVLLIAVLFILLAVRLDLAHFQQLGWRGAAFAAVVILVARPLSVLAATLGTKLSIAERLFLAWLAPRGIVAAAVASVFALELGDGDEFVAATFMVIVATVVTYSATSGLVARRLGLSESNPQGLLIAGAHRLGRDIAATLQELEIRVCLVDRNPQNIRRARMAGLTTYYADILSESIHEDLDLGGIGRFLSLLPNDEVNSLAAEHCGELFGRDQVYRLPASTVGSARVSMASSVMYGRELFAPTANYEEIRRRLDSGAVVKATTLSSEFTWSDFCERHGPDVLPLFQIQGRQVSIVTATATVRPVPGQTVIAVVPGAANDSESA